MFSTTSCDSSADHSGVCHSLFDRIQVSCNCTALRSLVEAWAARLPDSSSSAATCYSVTERYLTSAQHTKRPAIECFSAPARRPAWDTMTVRHRTAARESCMPPQQARLPVQRVARSLVTGVSGHPTSRRIGQAMRHSWEIMLRHTSHAALCMVKSRPPHQQSKNCCCRLCESASKVPC